MRLDAKYMSMSRFLFFSLFHLFWLMMWAKKVTSKEKVANWMLKGILWKKEECNIEKNCQKLKFLSRVKS